MAITCQHCGLENPGDTLYCRQCGHDMTKDETRIMSADDPGSDSPSKETQEDTRLVSPTEEIKDGSKSDSPSQEAKQDTWQDSPTERIKDDSESVPPSEEVDDPLLGQVIGGCLIESRIGEGGMCAVYRGTQVSLMRSVAVKILPRRLAKNAAYIARFLKESEIVASLHHPNIVAIHDRGSHGSLYYFIMEHIKGATLSEIISMKRTIAPGDALAIAYQAAQALKAAAAKSIIHRDIKPENIMIDENAIVKVMDFGLVKNTAESKGSLTAERQIMGTPSFMSPEQCKGEPTDNRSDIYSLGMTLYAMLAGRPAFYAEAPHGLMMLQISEIPKPVHERNPKVPESVWPVLERMLAKNPDDRFEDWQAVMDAFVKLQSEHPDEYIVSDLLQRSDSKRLPIISDAAPTPTPTPTTGPPRPRVETPPEFRTDVGPVSAYMHAAKAGKKKRLAFLGIGLFTLVFLIVIFAVLFVLPDQSDSDKPKPAAVPPPDRSAEVAAMAIKAEDALEAGLFDSAAAVMKRIRGTFGASENQETVETVRRTEERIAELEPQWRMVHGAMAEARKLEKSGDLPGAHKLLQITRARLEETRVREYLNPAIGSLEDRMQARYAQETGKARQFIATSCWDSAIEAWNLAVRFALSEEDKEKCIAAVREIRNLKAEEEKNKETERFEKLLEDARSALARHDLQIANTFIAELVRLRPGDKRVAGLADRSRLETLISIPAGKVKLKKGVVEVSAFAIGAYEVTNLMYGEFIEAGGYGERKYWSEEGWTWKEENSVTAPRFWKDEQFRMHEKPVIGVSYHEAEAFCAWLSEASGKRHRLPTVAEWECAAAGSDSSVWPWGPETEKTPANLRNAQSEGTVTVGKFPEGKSAVGCYDIIGNAAEWCRSDSAYYARGGSWLTSLERVKSDSESPIPPQVRSNRVGFRVVREVD
ncbi:MAG: hypothetical protein E3J72_16710 [Planctomycetota bacterium]|nr:MAG: hypothetical protein E3J72_16710 [Planctomycetota bacterium]